MSSFNLKKNWKLLAVIASLAVIVVVLVPGAASFLIFLACPLMMLFMMGGMGMDHSGHAIHNGGATSHSLPAPDAGAGAGNDQQNWQISQLQGQIQELQREQTLLKEQLGLAENRTLVSAATSTSINGSTNPPVKNTDTDEVK